MGGVNRERCPQAKVIMFLVCCLTLLLTPASLFADSMYSVAVNTSPISGTSAQLAFDFIDGGPPSNTIRVSNFSTDGTLGSNSPTGGVTGTLPGTVTLTDSSFFNEYLTNITLGTSFSFLLDATTNGPTVLPDAFSLFLLDPVTGFPLFTTTDPTFSNSLLTLNIDGSPQGALTVYSAPGGEVVTTATPVSAVPEPGTLMLMGIAVVCILSRRQLRKL
jgi:hypothetical protein